MRWPSEISYSVFLTCHQYTDSVEPQLGLRQGKVTVGQAQLQRLDLIVAHQRVDLLQRLETVDFLFQLGAQLSASVINQLAVLAVSRLFCLIQQAFYRLALGLGDLHG